MTSSPSSGRDHDFLPPQCQRARAHRSSHPAFRRALPPEHGSRRRSARQARAVLLTVPGPPVEAPPSHRDAAVLRTRMKELASRSDQGRWGDHRTARFDGHPHGQRVGPTGTGVLGQQELPGAQLPGPARGRHSTHRLPRTRAAPRRPVSVCSAHAAMAAQSSPAGQPSSSTPGANRHTDQPALVAFSRQDLPPTCSASAAKSGQASIPGRGCAGPPASSVRTGAEATRRVGGRSGPAIGLEPFELCKQPVAGLMERERRA